MVILLLVLIVLLIIAYFYKIMLVGPVTKFSSIYTNRSPVLAWYTNTESFVPHFISVPPGNIYGMEYYKNNNNFDTMYMVFH